MHHRFLICGLLYTLLVASWGNADLQTERKREFAQSIPGFAIRSYVDTFKANKRALAISTGEGATCLGMYVFDEHGNCVAKDDLTSPKTCDDLAAEWIPIATANYQVQIRNAGYEMNAFQLALR